jgi:hypothetical protein
MIPINRADDELFSTVVAAARLGRGRARAIVDRLSARYEQEWDDPMAGFPYALSMIALMQAGTDDEVDKGSAYNEIIEPLGDLLYSVPDHWLGRYLRSRMRAIIPPDATEYKQYAAAERARGMEDAEELIKRQSLVAWQPWFACPYLLTARLVWESEHPDPDRVAELVSTAAAETAGPIPFPGLNGILCEAFVWYYHQPGVPEPETVGGMMRTLFPDQPSVRHALGRGPAR